MHDLAATLTHATESDTRILDQAAKCRDGGTLTDWAAPGFSEKFTADHGADFATAVLFDRMMRHAGNAAFADRVAAAPPDLMSLPTRQEWFAGIVPGAFYREHRGTGADGAAVCQLLDALFCPWELLPVGSFGTPAANARIIADWLRRHSGKRMIIFSLSKGSLDFASLLEATGEDSPLPSVAAWISLSGLPLGTPLTAWLQRQTWRRLAAQLWLRWHGHRFSTLACLQHRQPSSKPWPALPETMKVVHVSGFPLRSHLAHPWAVRGHARLAPLGPNDGGGLLLADLAKVPGTVFPVWGADHYLQPQWGIAPLLGRVLHASISQD